MRRRGPGPGAAGHTAAALLADPALLGEPAAWWAELAGAPAPPNHVRPGGAGLAEGERPAAPPLTCAATAQTITRLRAVEPAGGRPPREKMGKIGGALPQTAGAGRKETAIDDRVGRAGGRAGKAAPHRHPCRSPGTC
ncbi:hypothetical protein AB0N77_22090 [Streptomyces misionensis]|uniref:hypothetical protein n=1 Tax=Streptomyces misionensis TaxID=67331 RepID=UPI0034124B98